MGLLMFRNALCAAIGSSVTVVRVRWTTSASCRESLRKTRTRCMTPLRLLRRTLCLSTDKVVGCLDYLVYNLLLVGSKWIRCWACRCRLVIGQSVDCVACEWGECEAKANEMLKLSSVFRKFTYSWIAMICARVICYASRWHKLAAVVQSAMRRFFLVLTFCVLTTLFHRRCWQLFDLPYCRSYLIAATVTMVVESISSVQYSVYFTRNCNYNHTCSKCMYCTLPISRYCRRDSS